MHNYKILWADDEIDLLRPHILFLENKGYKVTPVNSGSDAVEICEKEYFDVVFLDENMPGMTGLEALKEIKSRLPNLPIVMITKSEEETIMEEAIGGQISDYLIKPLNPNQILMSVKKILDNKRLVSEHTSMGYQQDFRDISTSLNDYMDFDEWAEVFKKITKWELAFDKQEDAGMQDILETQKVEANNYFASFIEDNYEGWLEGSEESPLLSHQIMSEKVFPQIGKGKPVFFLVIDNLRYDQWLILKPFVLDYFNLQQENSYYSILPTTTAYARNSIFSGLMPLDMAKKQPNLWVGEDVDGGKNNNEDKFLEEQLRREGLNIKWNYQKIIHTNQGKNLVDSINSLMGNDLNVIVYNFVDMLSHARTDMAMIKDLAPDESGYRSLTSSWFNHSPLLDALKKISTKDATLIITTDHGTIRVKRPFKIIGDKNTNTNLRYKQGKNLSYDNDDVLVAPNPEKFMLPKVNVSSSYVFALKNQFFAYPNNYNYYVKYYRDTFQHGGVSLEEMIIPIITLSSRNGR
jgi:CheY-like chemotaxis protein